MSTVSLDEILAEREHRELFRRELLEKFRMPCITLTLNIFGAEKRSSLSDYAFALGKRAVFSAFGEPLHFAERAANAGCCAFFLYDLPAEKLKENCVKIEDSCGGRLFDLDVHNFAGKKLSRAEKRRCFLCEKPAAECARSRAHEPAALLAKTKGLLSELAAEGLSKSAEKALYDELYLTPKPGLVDLENSGAHSDMCAADFEHAISVLRPFFKKAVLMGLENSGMGALQPLGIKAEGAMFAATGGINTHKGAIYLFLLILYGAGAALAYEKNAFEAAAETAKSGVPAKDTHGEKVRKEYPACGARAEAENGFPTAKKALLSLRKGEAPLRVLFEIMAECSDTNVLFRGGKSALDFVRKSSSTALLLGDEELVFEARRLDGEFIRKNLSPGGCADLLALAIFMNSEPEIFPL